MKFAFVTCVQIGLSCMEAIYKSGGKLELVITLKDHQAVNKSGRVYLDDFCQQHGVSLHKTEHINNSKVCEIIKQKEIDWLFIIGWSQIADEQILSAPVNGVLGMHPTLLPVGRGRAAIPWAIIKDLPKTGVTLFKLDKGVDTGPILAQLEIPLDNDINATQLYEKVNAIHVDLMLNIIPDLINNTVEPVAQDERLATCWPGRKPTDGEIDLKGSVYDSYRLIRAVTHPYPGAFTTLDGIKYIIWNARIVDHRTGDLCLTFKDGFLECTDWERAE